MEWDSKLRYRPYRDWTPSELSNIKQHIQNSNWRLNYHIQPSTGLLNDPNGFSYFNNHWHLFYQQFPFGAVHGMKSWHHLESTDLIDWHDLGIALEPSTPYDSHGVFSGSALVNNDELFLMYTGNVRDKNWVRHSYQNLAVMTSKNQVKKYEKPLIADIPSELTAEFRDPQVLKVNGKYRVILGAQTKQQNGAIALYEGTSLQDLHYHGLLNFADNDTGFMIECPNLIQVDGQDVLIYCPQGMKNSITNYQNIYPNCYMIGKLNWDNNYFQSSTPITNLDEGFDIYATQAFNAPDGRALSISWLGLPEMSYPTDQEDWSGALSLVRELRIIDNQLYQYPVSETRLLRQESRKFNNNFKLASTSNAYELEVNIAQQTTGKISLMDGLTIDFDTIVGKLTVNRKNTHYDVNPDFGTTRTATFSPTSLILNVFVDNSVIEIYINKGQQVISLRYFPYQGASQLAIQADQLFTSTMWNLQKIN